MARRRQAQGAQLRRRRYDSRHVYRRIRPINAPYQPPTDILDVLRDIEFEDALTAEDARYVDTREARGSQKTLRMLSRMFGLQLPDGPFRWPLTKHVLDAAQNAGSHENTAVAFSH